MTRISLADNPAGAAIILRTSYESRNLAKQVPGYRWSPERKAWVYPCNEETLRRLLDLFPTAVVERAVREAVARAREARAAAEEARRRMDGEELPSRTRAYAHQRAAAEFAKNLRHTALLMEMGTGKSKVVVDLALWRWRNEGLSKLLVICPKSVARVWKEEFGKHGIEPADVRVLDGSVDDRVETLLTWPPSEQLQVAVVNYEATWRLEDAITAWQPEMVVADESHKIKDPSTRQSKALHKIGALPSVRWRMILTGTPTPNNLLEIFSQYKFLDPGIFGRSWFAFRHHYGIWGGYGGHELVGYQDKEDLLRKMHSVAFRITKAEALDLPETTQVVRYVELSPETRKVYERIRRDAIAVLESGQVVTARIVLTQLLRLSQVTGGFVTTESGAVEQVGTEKLEALRDALEELGSKQVVIFCRFLPELRAIQNLLKQMGLSVGTISGEVSADERAWAVEQFQRGYLQVIAAQIATGGLGITLHAADTAIFYSMDYSFANHDQACARLHRVGQRRPVTYIYLLAQNTIDEGVFRAVQEKRNLIEEVDRWREILGITGGKGDGSGNRGDAGLVHGA